ncbi:MAG: hypothetical protein J5518_10090 [Lachnospiraceae bacterium]|nr:hypothetical protein [Lachnospiraceae bacterium]
MKDPLEEIRIEQRQQEAYAYLDTLSKAGMRVSVEGYYLPLAQMAKMISLSEEICYMPDFVTDTKGKLVEVRFDRVALT